MSEFVQVAKTSDLADPGQILAEVDDRIVVLMKVGGEFFCLDDVCTHDGGPLSDGRLDDHTIACPRHGAKFDIRSGKALTMPATQDTACHEIQIRGDEVWVRINDAGASPARPVAAAASPQAAEDSRPGSTHDTGDWEPEAARKIVEAAPEPYAAGGLSEDLVREELKKVIDPELFVNIVDLGLIYNVNLVPASEEGKLDCKIDMTMTSPMCPAGPQMIQNSKQVLGQLAGMGNVEVKIVLDPPWTPDKMTQEARDALGIF
jgi:metal-sulfur cluster biosynthetic enzyme/nitrite reductase/ring-hydroxylating ferredoxin subunit